MKLGTLAREPFMISFRKLMQQKIPVRTSFKLRGIAKQINDELSKFNETKEHLACEHAVKGEDGMPVHEVQNGQDTIKLDPAMIPSFIKKMRELEDIEVDIPAVMVRELGKEGDLTLVPDDYFHLEFLQE